MISLCENDWKETDVRRIAPSMIIAVTALFAVLSVAVVAMPATASAATRDATALWPREKPWVTSLVPLLNDMSGASKQVAKLSTDPTVLVSGSNAQVRLAVALAVLGDCPSALKRKGPAPTNRLRQFRGALNAACTHYAQSAIFLARGIDRFDVNLIERATAEMQLATRFLGKANRLLIAFR